MIRLILTCHACPEAYDAYTDDMELVGYLRLRHGQFTVHCPDYGGDLVYEAQPKGDGIFDESERDYYLSWAVKSIEDWIARGRVSDEMGLPPKPDVEYSLG